MEITNSFKNFNDAIFKATEEYLNTIPSFHLRDKSGDNKYLEIDITTNVPNPFWCINIKIYPNGKEEEK